jgi:hypothetical protein
VDGRAAGRLREQGVQIAKVFLEFAKLARIDIERSGFDGKGKLRFLVSEFGLEDVACAGDRISLVVEEAFDPERHLDVATTVEPLASAAFVRLQLRKFTFPEAENIGWNIAKSGYFPDAKVELVRDVRPGWGDGFTDWLVLCHARNSDTGVPDSGYPA